MNQPTIANHDNEEGFVMYRSFLDEKIKKIL